MRILYLLFISLYLLISISTGFAQNSEDSAILQKAEALVQSGDYNQARQLYSFYIRFHPDNIHALSQRAVVYATLQDFPNAYDDIDHAFESAGFSAIDQAVIHNNRGQIYFLERNTALALQDFSRAIALDSTYADYWLNRGILYQVLEEWDKALSDYDTYLDLVPDDSEVYLNIARIHLAQQDLDNAIIGLNSAISVNPGDPELYIFRGSINLLRKAFADAAVDYRDWMRLINVTEVEQDVQTEAANELTLDMAYGVMHRIPFEASSGDRLGIVANSTSVDALVVLLDPEGIPIMADDDGGQGLNAFFVDFALPQDGTYTLLVGHARGGWTGEIDLTIQIVPEAGI